MTKVSIVKSVRPATGFQEVREQVKKSIDLLGGIGEFINPGDRVFVKPSLLLSKGPEFAITTNPVVVQSVVDIVLKEGKAGRVIVGDMPRQSSWSRDVLKGTGTESVAIEAGAEVRYIDEDRLVEVEIPEGVVMAKALLPETVLSVDKVIYIPKLKTHWITIITCAIKSAQGLLVSQEKAKFHRQDLHHKLVDLFRVVRPNLCVVDALTVMEGQGPAWGTPVRFDTIVSGGDAVAVDSVCASMMGFDPFEVPTTRIAHHDGLGQGDLNRITVVGNSLEEARRTVKRADANIEGVHPKVETFVGGPCIGCLVSSRALIETAMATGALERVDRLSVITGVDVHLPRNPKGEMVFVVGDCAEKHRARGIFVPGCPPLNAMVDGMKKLEEYLKQKDKN